MSSLGCFVLIWPLGLFSSVSTVFWPQLCRAICEGPDRHLGVGEASSAPPPPTQGRRTHVNLPQQPLPLSISVGHQRGVAKQTAAAGEGRGGRVGGKVIFTIQAVRAALLISYMCPFRRWGRFWGRGRRPSWRRPASPSSLHPCVCLAVRPEL